MQNEIAIVFVVIVSISIAIQAGVLFAIFKAMSRLNEQVASARKSVDQIKDPLFADVKALLNQTIELVSNLNRISSDFTQISTMAREQIEKVDGLFSETTDLARSHVYRLDAIVSDAVDHIEHTKRVVQDNILAPVREVSAVIKGVKVGLDFLTTRRQPSAVDKATQDEAMFI